VGERWFVAGLRARRWLPVPGLVLRAVALALAVSAVPSLESLAAKCYLLLTFTAGFYAPRDRLSLGFGALAIPLSMLAGPGLPLVLVTVLAALGLFVLSASTGRRLEARLEGEQLRRALLLETRRMATLSDLARGLAHELSQHVFALRGFSRRLERRAAPALNEIVATATHMQRLVSGVRQIARAERAAAEPVDPMQILRWSVSLLESRLAREAIDVRWPGEEVAAAGAVAVCPPLEPICVGLLLGATELAACRSRESPRVLYPTVEIGTGGLCIAVFISVGDEPSAPARVASSRRGMLESLACAAGGELVVEGSAAHPRGYSIRLPLPPAEGEEAVSDPTVATAAPRAPDLLTPAAGREIERQPRGWPRLLWRQYAQSYRQEDVRRAANPVLVIAFAFTFTALTLWGASTPAHGAEPAVSHAHGIVALCLAGGALTLAMHRATGSRGAVLGLLAVATFTALLATFAVNAAHPLSDLAAFACAIASVFFGSVFSFSWLVLAVVGLWPTLLVLLAGGDRTLLGFVASSVPLFWLISSSTGSARHLARQRDAQLDHSLVAVGRQAAVGRVVMELVEDLTEQLRTLERQTRSIAAARDLPDEEASSELQLLEVAVQRMRRVTESIPVVGNVVERAPEPLDPVGPVTLALCLVEHDLRVRAVTVSSQLAPRALPLVRSDETQLLQVFVNLLLNSAEALATRPQGSPRHVYLSARTSPRFLTLCVEDDGPGISAGDAALIFEPGFTTKPAGCGLGLPLSRRLLRAMGGDLRFEPRAQGGARFLVVLPIATPHAASTSERVEGVCGGSVAPPILHMGDADR